jgi:hypothetical protein
MKLIEKIAQGEVKTKAKRLRGISSVLAGATTGLFAGHVLGGSRKASLIGAGLGALFGATAEAATRDIEAAQEKQITRWAGHWTPGDTAPHPFSYAEHGAVTRGRGQPVILRVARSYGRAS